MPSSTTAAAADNNNNKSNNKEATNKLPPEKKSVYFSIPEDPSYVYPVSSFPQLSFFEIHQTYPALLIPAKRTAELRNTLSSVILHRPKIRSVVPVTDPSDVEGEEDDIKKYRKLILDGDVESIWETNETLRTFLQKENEQQQLQHKIQKSTHTIQLGYADLTVEETLRKLLPVREIPSAFEIVGHIAHVNLRTEVLPFELIVGKVILEKNTPRIQTVVNKVGSIDTEFRTFGMKVIASTKGDSNNDDDNKDWSIVTVREEKCKFQLDFRTVYWNSRLGGEHRRLVQLIRRDASSKSEEGGVVVADLMAGVGPFAVPLTTTITNKNGGKTTTTSSNNNNITVYANDLNPESYKYLKINSFKNKCENLHSYNMDARAFVHDLDTRGIIYHHVIMNLPASAPEFLDAFRGYQSQQTFLPRIHVHCFAEKSTTAVDNKNTTECNDTEDEDRAVLERCSKALGCSLDVVKHQVSIHIVRDVAPKKNMLCVSFNLPDEIRSVPRLNLIEKEKGETAGGKDNSEDSIEPPCKKSRPT